MKKPGLKDRLVDYLKRHGGWVHSGTLQSLVITHTDYMPRTAVRRLQEAVEEGLLEVRYEKGSALYRASTDKAYKTIKKVVFDEATHTARMVEVRV